MSRETDALVSIAGLVKAKDTQMRVTGTIENISILPKSKTRNIGAVAGPSPRISRGDQIVEGMTTGTTMRGEEEGVLAGTAGRAGTATMKDGAEAETSIAAGAPDALTPETAPEGGQGTKPTRTGIAGTAMTEGTTSPEEDRSNLFVMLSSYSRERQRDRKRY